MSLFRIEKLTKAYDNRVVLDLPKLEIEKNQITALLGPNGAGKTTLLNMLAFLESPTSGKIWYQHKQVKFTRAEIHALRREVVLLEQYPILFSTTVFKNIEFGLKVRNIPAKKREYIITEALELVGMQDFSTASARRLSGGETQRVAIARALALSPKFFLCDEPTSSVDVENQAVIVSLLRELNETKKMSILFSTHDRSLATSLAHQTLALDHGRLATTAIENVFSATIQCDKNGAHHCTLNPNVTLISAANIPPSFKQPTRIFIDPIAIQLVSNEEQQLENNVVKGVVFQIVKENDRIKIGVDTGIRLTLLIPEEEYQRKRIIIGDTLILAIPPGAVRPVL